MKKLAIATVGALFSLTAMGQDLLQCLHPDVANGLLFGGNPAQQVVVTSELPQSLSGFRAPTGFTLIGTAERVQTETTTVAYMTNLERGDALGALVSAFGADGWELEEEILPVAPVFTLSSAPTRGTICRDGERLALSIRDNDGTRFANLDSVGSDRPRGCHEEDPRMSMRPSMMGGIQEYFPSLTFPESTQAADGGSLGGGFSGAGDSTRTSARIESPDSAQSLSSHLGAQMLEQGWRQDASWSGNLSAGASWMKLEDDTTVWGTLDIIGVDDDTYEVALRLLMDF